jgi:ABC-2 type transport system permease protein/sodium transport system permease protein
LYGSQATWSDLLRRPHRQQETPSVAGTLFCLAITYPLYFLLANSLYRMTGATMAGRLVLSATVTVLLFAGLPLLASLLQRTRISTTFQLRRAPLLAWIAALLLGISLWPMAHEIFLLNELLGLKSLRTEQLESVEQMLAQWHQISPLLILLTLAVTPGLCEEFFFRGYLIGSHRRAMPAWVTILVSAVLFGIFHVITTSVLATERLLPSTFLGLVLGWICIRTGSVLPGMLLHTVHNGLLLMVAYYRDELLDMGFGIEERTHLPPLWLALSGLGIAIGIGLIWLSTRRHGSGDCNPMR